MCSDCNKIALSTMSKSELLDLHTDNNHQECQLDCLLTNPPTLDFQDNPHVLHVSSSNREDQDKEKEEEEQEKGKIPSLGGLNAMTSADDEEESGFKTPTSLGHKIPVPTQCPGAPRKPKFPFSSRKRKAAASSSSSSSASSASSSPPSSNARRCLQLDLSQEVDSLFPMPILADMHRKIKKARTDDNDTQLE